MTFFFIAKEKICKYTIDLLHHYIFFYYYSVLINSNLQMLYNNDSIMDEYEPSLNKQFKHN